jgi:1,4-dihydroxy-2-naphthoyl-CoA synthase
MCEAAESEWAGCLSIAGPESVAYGQGIARVAAFAAYAGNAYTFLSGGTAKAREDWNVARRLSREALHRGISGDTKTMALATLAAANRFFAQNGGE